MTAFPKLFEPARIGSLELKNRLIMAPIEKNYADPTGGMTQRYLDYLVERAKGGVGLILLESMYVDPLGRNHIAQLGLYDDRLIAGYRAAIDAMHTYGCKAGAELEFGGRETSSWVTGRRPVAPSPVPCNVLAGGEVPRELTGPEIGGLVRKFAEAARRAVEAGFDLIEIHGAHGYLIEQFLSPYSNRRTDEYGGTPEKRARFPLEVVRAVREVVGPNYPVIYRISAAEFVEGGLTTEDTAAFARSLENEGIDLIDVSAGIYESIMWIAQPSSYQPGCLVDLAQPIRRSVRIPVSVVGRINDPALAEEILQQGKADFILMGRPLHADPELPNKAMAGDVGAINKCPACMTCSDQLGTHLPIACMINPAAGREREFRVKPTEHPKRVIVVGGGPGGLSAARMLALRGHRVTVVEKENELGGAMRLASLAPHKAEFMGVIHYLAEQLRRLGVEVQLGQAATVDSIATEDPDAVVVATGAIPVLPSTPGIASDPRIATANDVLEGRAQVGRRALVMGAGMTGCETAVFMSETGVGVTIVEPTDIAPRGVGLRAGWTLREELKNNPRISVKTRTTVEGIAEGTVRLRHEGEEMVLPDIDSIVVAVGVMANGGLASDLLRSMPQLEVYQVGDCVLPRRALDAIYEGAVVGMRI